jgi:hypothetical protein
MALLRRSAAAKIVPALVGTADPPNAIATSADALLMVKRYGADAMLEAVTSRIFLIRF